MVQRDDTLNSNLEISMKKLLFFSLLFMMFGNVWAQKVSKSDAPTPVGEWRFDEPANLGAATIGNPLVPYGDKFTAVSGPTDTDGAVRVGVGSYYILTHGYIQLAGTQENNNGQ